VAENREAEVAIAVYPLTAERWDDLTRLFGASGAQGGCWCMWWRLPGTEFGAGAGRKNREAFQAIVESGREPGLLAYAGDRPVGWVAVAPGEEFLARRLRSRYWKPVDEAPVWSINCFFIARDQRGAGLARLLLEAAVAYAAAHGARIVEAYPKDLGGAPANDTAVYMGTIGMFRDAGFTEVARRHPTYAIMRREL
jgi:GNAT superfamily N-acetyltransferase